MSGAILKGGIIGGLVMFAWGAVSHALFEWHGTPLLSFKDEEAVRQAVVASAARPGVYVLPNYPPQASAEQKKAMMPSMEEKWQQGPMVFSSIRLGPLPPMPRLLGVQAAIDVFVALLASALLVNARPLAYGGRVLFVLGVGLAAAIAGFLPMWNWWAFSGHYTAVEFADTLVAWLLGGLVIAKFAR